MLRYNSIFSLDEKVSLVVGVGGIGEKVAQGLHNFGAEVICADIDVNRARNIAYEIYKDDYHLNDINDKKINSNYLQLDITNTNNIKQALDIIISNYKQLDIVVNLVGFNIFKDTFDMSIDEFNDILSVNLTGIWDLSKKAAQLMKNQKICGKIINTASITAFFGSPGQGAYAAAKAGLVNITKTLALEWIKYGIYVNAISPVMTETPINKTWLSENPQRKKNIMSKIPIGRLGNTNDFIGPVIFLASQASDFVVGQTIPVDGGTSINHPLIE